MTAIGTALSGMQASLARLNAAASNIANANSTGPIPATSAAQPVGTAAPGQAQVYQAVTVSQSETVGGGTAAQTVPVVPSYIPTYDPTSTHADPSGMVAAPNVDVADQLVEQMTAKVAYEANLKVMQTANRMGETTLEVWG